MPIYADEIKNGLSPVGLADALGISVTSARRLITLRKIESHKVGGRIKVTERAVKDYLERSRIKANK